MSKLQVRFGKMIPANGWAAIYESDHSSTALPLVCWADINAWEENKEGVINEIDYGIGGMVVSDDGNVVPARALSGFKTYQYDLEGANVDFVTMSNDG